MRIAEVLLHGSQPSAVVVNRWIETVTKAGLPATVDAACLSRPSVAIIGALELPQCRKYRILQKIEELAAHGCSAVVSNYFDVPRCFDVLQLATAVVFYRVPDGALFQAYVGEARRLGIPVTFDVDDPLFCSTVYSANANLQTLSRAERDHLVSSCRDYLSAMRCCDAVIVSTPGLAEVATPYMEGKPVYLWRNAIDAESRSICEDVRVSSSPRPAGQIRIGYMSGSRAHDLDFEVIGNALARVLAKYPHVEMVIAGHAGLPEQLKPFEHRMSVFPFSSYRGYFQTLSEVDIVVIPLLSDTFNACKSAIRFLEAALLGKPCVASMVGDFLNVVVHGKTGYLADSEADWEASLARLIELEDERKTIGANARESVLAHQTTDAVASALDARLLNTLRGGANA